VGILDKYLSKKPTKEDFAKKVLEALEKGGAGKLRYNPADNSIRVESRDATFYMDNAYTDYLATAKGARSGVIQRYVSSFLHHKPIPKDFASVKASLLPIVKDPAYFSLSLLMLKADGKDTSKIDDATEQIAEGLVTAIACDTEHTIMTVNRSTLEEWGATFEEALEIATSNLRDKTKPEGMKELAPGLFVSQWGDCYDSARLLLPDFFHRLSLSGDPVVFVPNRDQLWVTGRYNKAGINVILTHGRQSHFEQGHTLSPNLYVHADGKWEIYVPEDDALKKLYFSVKRQRDGMDYAQQKGYLEKLYKRENRDIFVATCVVYKEPDESLRTRCAWSNGVDSLLPETDEIAFVKDVQKKDIVTAGWNEVQAIVGSMMDREPEMVPVRYRVESFPNANQLSRLREMAKGKSAEK